MPKVYRLYISINVKRLGVRNVHMCVWCVIYITLRIRSMYNMYEEETVEGCFFNWSLCMARSTKLELYFAVLLPLCARVSPTNRYANVRGKVGSIMCSRTQSTYSLSFIFGFLKTNIPISFLDFDSHHPPSFPQSNSPRYGFRVRLTRLSHSIWKRD